MKGSLVCLAVIFFGFYCFKVWPFINNKLNNLQVFSSLVQIVTILLGMCINQLESSQTGIKLFLSLLTIGFNIAFGVFSFNMVFDEMKFILRKFVMKFQNKAPVKLVNYFDDIATREKMAKFRWMKLKSCIYKTVKFQKENKLENPF